MPINRIACPACGATFGLNDPRARLRDTKCESSNSLYARLVVCPSCRQQLAVTGLLPTFAIPIIAAGLFCVLFDGQHPRASAALLCICGATYLLLWKVQVRVLLPADLAPPPALYRFFDRPVPKAVQAAMVIFAGSLLPVYVLFGADASEVEWVWGAAVVAALYVLAISCLVLLALGHTGPNISTPAKDREVQKVAAKWRAKLRGPAALLCLCMVAYALYDLWLHVR